MLLLVDLDGVVYRGPVPVAGMPELLRQRVAAGDVVVYVTNNSRWHRTEYQARLRSMGAPVAGDRIVSAGRAAALALAEHPQRPRTALVLGGPGLTREIRDAGLRAVAASPVGLASDPDAVVVGVDFSLTYRRLSITAEVVRRGVLFVATNRDPVYPTAETLAAGAGSIVAAVVVAGGREPDLVIGKPEPGLFREAARSVGMPVEEAIVIGDGLSTDVAAAVRVGARSVLMLTGVSTRAQADGLPAAARPTWIAQDPAELARLLEHLNP